MSHFSSKWLHITVIVTEKLKKQRQNTSAISAKKHILWKQNTSLLRAIECYNNKAVL